MMASLAPADVSSMKVNELKAALDQRGLDTTGVKKDLAARLLQALSTPAGGSAQPAPQPAPQMIASVASGFYLQRDPTKYNSEPILPSAALAKLIAQSRDYANASQQDWSGWVQDVGPLPQLTAASMLLPRVDQLPPPDMRVPDPLRRLDPAALRHFELQRIEGVETPVGADGAPLPPEVLQRLTVMKDGAPPSGRSSAEGSEMAEKAEKVEKAEKGSKSDRIWQMARSLFEARPAVSDGASEPPALSLLPENPAVRGSTFPPAQSVPPAQWLSDPTSIEPGSLARQLLKAMPELDRNRRFCTEQHGATDLPGRFTELIVALRAYEEKKLKRKKEARDADSQPTAKRPRPG